MKKVVLLAFVSALLLMSMFDTQLVITGDPTTHHVYSGESIQEAINSAQSGDTIIVHSGTYYEHVVVNKTVSLIGENRQNTRIDGSGTGAVVEITANNVNISKFTIQNGFWGINLDGSNNTVSSNNVTSNQRVGILLGGSNNTFRDNNITGSQLNLYLYSWATGKRFYHDIDPSNTVDGKPIYYLVNQHNQQIPQDAGYVAAVNCTNITIRDLNLQKNTHGVFFVNTTYSTVENVTVLDTVYGIFLRDSSNNTIYKNTVSGWSEMQDGILLEGSGNNVSFNILRVENGIGVFIKGPGNTISNNDIIECGGGIRVQSENNIIYHNNFIDNTIYQAILYPEPYNNTWDDGYPSGGNYWSDYTGVDLYSGPYQNETDSDGIGDTSYVIDEKNQDNYPLMNPWSPEEEVPEEVAIGVEEGDWVKYGNISYSFESNIPGATEPTEFKEMFVEVQWLKLEVTGVSGNTITFNMSTHYNNGTEYTETVEFIVGAATEIPIIIEANLQEGDTILGTYQINETVSRTYADATRNVNHVLVSTEQTWHGITFRYEYDYCWDKTTGILCEMEVEIEISNATHSATTSLSVKMTGTNIWKTPPPSPPPFWTQWWLWTIVAVGIMALAGAVYFLKKRKPPTPTAPTLPTEGT